MIIEARAGMVRTPMLPVLATAAVLATGVLAGCAARPARPPAPPAPPPAGADTGYDARRDPLDGASMAALAGRRIALDPGHGGSFRGALGVNGLTESEVNLGVALHLRGLLEARGAEVFMTRTDERDFLSAADSSLRADLAARTARANAWSPDLFVSIHHNADAGSRHDVNEIQTYYKLNDEGPSLDAAESIHRYLVRNLGIRAQKILPGNYFVLRNNVAPAILTESSYITNPGVEARLQLAAKQRLEAEALLLGIAHYFARGAPRVTSFVLKASPRAAPDSTFHDVAVPIFEATVDGPFDQAALTLDGRPVPLNRFADRLEAHLFAPLAPGTHTAVLDVRRAGAGAARSEVRTFELTRSPHALEVQTWPPLLGPGQASALRIYVRDAFGFPLPDSIPVRVRAPAGFMPRDTQVISRDGVAWAYAQSTGAIPGAPFTIEARGVPAARATFLEATGGAPVWSGVAINMTSGRALANAPGTREPDRLLPWLSRDGFAVLPRGVDGAVRVPALPGYRRWPGNVPDEIDAAKEGVSRGTLGFVPIAGGALHGRRIVIDPDGGGDRSAGVGPNGSRAAHVNLRVGRILKGFLEAAGAHVRLTRDGDLALSDVERVQISEAFAAERYLRIGHRAEAPRLGHYFSSSAGRAWAGRTSASLERFGFAKPSVGADAQYPLQQTSCPALYVSCARIDVAASEEALLAAGALRTEAYALFLALAREWAPEAAWPLDSLEVRDGSGRPVSGAAVWLGDALLVETDARGRARFARTEGGPLEARVEDSRVQAQTILLESTRGAILTGPDGR